MAQQLTLEYVLTQLQPLQNADKTQVLLWQGSRTKAEGQGLNQCWILSSIRRQRVTEQSFQTSKVKFHRIIPNLVTLVLKMGNI